MLWIGRFPFSKAQYDKIGKVRAAGPLQYYLLLLLLALF